MKLNLTIATILLASGVLHAGKSFSQNVVIHFKNTNLEAVFEEMEKQTGYAFFYDEKIPTARFDADFQDMALSKVLDHILKPFNLSYQLRGMQIVIIENKTLTAETSPRNFVQNTAVNVRGRVTDGGGEPLAGVIVQLRGTAVAASTDSDGRFVLSDIPADAVLVFLYIGYDTAEVAVGDRTEINVSLSENALMLADVVAVGYGTQKKENLTGSVESISPQALISRPASNTSQLLQGNVSGVNFTYSNYGAEPGAALSLTVRGQGSPYVIIDGVPGNMNLVNPNDIESISVLKDAAASAIYGARAPYGVVLITTKSGRHNEKIRVDFSANVSLAKIINKPHQVDAHTFARALNEMADNAKAGHPFKNEVIDRIIAYMNDPSLPQTTPNGNSWNVYYDSNGNNDWMDIHFGNGARHQENISASGGGERLSFFISAGHVFEKGPFRYGTDNYRRINYSSKLDFNLAKWWELSSNTRIVQTERKFPNGDEEGSYRTMIHQILRIQPQDYFKSPNGYYSLRSRIATMENGCEHTTNRGLVQRFATEITPLRNWKINADYAVDFTYTDFDNIRPTIYLDNVDGTLYPFDMTDPATISKWKRHTLYQTYNVYTSYGASINKAHNFNLMAGYQYESNRSDRLSGSRTGMITSSVPSLSTSTGENPTVGDDLSHWATSGYFARFNYDYKGRYLFEANFRHDGTSCFAKGNRWGIFPSVSAGWNIAAEKFWEPALKYVNAFKLRASWGRLGNQNVDAYQDLARLTVNQQVSWIVDGVRPPYVTGPNLINLNLTWETSETFDVGIDLGFLRNRLLFAFDAYQRMTFNRLGPAAQLPAVLGAPMPQENNSELRTRGWDLSLSWRDNPGKKFSYSVTATLFDYKTVVTKYPNRTGILTTNYPGQVAGEIWGYETVGFIRTPEQARAMTESGRQRSLYAEWNTGDIIYADLDGDGVITTGDNTVGNPGDRRIIGNSTPRFQFGLTLTAAWRGLDFRAFFQGTGKRDYWLTGNMFWGFASPNQTTLYPHHLDYYRDTEGDTYSGLGINTEAFFPRPYSTNTSKNKQIQTKYLQNGAYVRLKNIQIGYSLPASWLGKIGLSELRIYLSGENIWTLSSLNPGFDPETANMGQLGDGKSMFTQAIYAVGLNISF